MTRTGRNDAAARWARRHQMLLNTLIGVGVDLTDDDHTTAEWIAGWEPDTVRTIASWIARAAVAGRAHAQ